MAHRLSDEERLNLERELAVVREEFCAALPARIADLTQALAGGLTPERLSAARLMAHRLAGVAGSHGFHALGDHAGVLEAALIDAMNSADPGAHAGAVSAAHQQLVASAARVPDRDDKRGG